MKKLIIVLITICTTTISYGQVWKFMDATPEKVLSNYKDDAKVKVADIKKDLAGNIVFISIVNDFNSTKPLIGQLSAYIFEFNKGTCIKISELYAGKVPETIKDELSKKYDYQDGVWVDRSNKIQISLIDNNRNHMVSYFKLPKSKQ